MTPPHENFTLLCDVMQLTPYQRAVLRDNYDKYNMSGLVKRGRVLYAPHAHRGFWQFAKCVFMGECADLIASDKFLVQNQSGIKFDAYGYHCANGCYADGAGRIISREMFLRGVGGDEH